jgi:hypothetical protein
VTLRAAAGMLSGEEGRTRVAEPTGDGQGPSHAPPTAPEQRENHSSENER